MTFQALGARGARLLWALTPGATSLARSRIRRRNLQWLRILSGNHAKGGKPSVPMASVHPEASDNLLEVLHGASIDEEHRTIMSAVVKKVQSAKSGLTEACASLLTGFVVSNQIVRKCYSIDSSP